MKRPVLKICTSCRTDEKWDGETFFAALKEERKARGLKPLFKLREAHCLGGCDTPCNATLKGEDRPKLEVTWLDGEADVKPLIEAARKYALGQGELTHRGLNLPGRPNR